MENGSWAATVEKNIKKVFETSNDISYFDTTVHIKSKVSEESLLEIKKLAKEIIKI